MSEINFDNLPAQVVDYIKALQTKVEKQEMLIKNLNEMLTKNKKAMFGKSGEQIKYMDGAEQLSLFNEAEQEYNGGAVEPTKETIVKEHIRKEKRTKEELTENLPHKEVVIELEDKNCGKCGSELVVIGKEKLRSELNIVPAQIFVIDYFRNVYKCKKCEEKTDTAEIIKPDAPVAVMKKSMASPATVAYVMQEKYQMGTPLFRQEQYWKSKGVELNRNTLANWIIRSSQWFAPLWELMKRELLCEDILHADETELRVLKRDGKPTDSMSRMWVFTSGKYSKKPMALYKYHPTRSAKVVEEMLGNYSGYLQTDGYSAYNSADKATRIGCWSHARRKWVECLPKGIEDKSSKAARAFELIEQLFSIEKGFEGMPEKDIYTARLKKTKPVLDSYWRLLESIDAPGGSNLAKAVVYSFNQKTHLENVLLDGRIELTNNRAERAVKPFVIGRKNWLFSDTDKGADSSALCYSLIESAKLNGLDVYGYLLLLLTELPKLGNEPSTESLKNLLPWAKLPDYCYIG